MSMGTAAFAASITINQNADADAGTAGAESYKLYKIFDVTKTEAQEDYKTTAGGAGTENGFSYTISKDSPWVSVLGSFSGETWTPAEGQGWVTLTKSVGDENVYNVTYDSTKNSEAEAKKFAEFLFKNKGTIGADETMNSNGTTAVKADVDDGYWLIESTLGTALVLATSDIEITTKNQYVTDEKTVAETSYNVGDIVTFTITVNLPATIDYTKPVTVHDTMDSVLSLFTNKTGDNAWSAVVGSDTFTDNVTLVESSSFGTGHSESHASAEGKTLFDFVLDISSLAPATGVEPTAKVVTITYKAELTSAAAADTGLVNKEFTEYSKYETVPNEATVYTFDFDLDKEFVGATGTASDLEATFELTDSEGNTIMFKKDDTGYVKVDSDDGAGSATITVNGKDVINVRGLDEGTYTLTEKTTADGYNLLTDPITVTITDTTDTTATPITVTHTVKYKIGSGAETTNHTITVQNQSGTVLPSTGGIGTTIFYVVGSIMVVAAGVLLITKKRMSREG